MSHRKSIPPRTDYIDGPEFVREFQLPEICHVGAVHAHHFDHMLHVVAGAVTVTKFFERDGVQAVGEEVELEAGQEILVPAGVLHQVKARSPNVKYECRFKHRDWNGEIVQEYQGNAHAYC